MRFWSAPLLLLWLSWASAARADVSVEFDQLRADFEYGKYQEVIRRAEARLSAPPEPGEAEALELHLLTGLCAFNLDDPQTAERAFAQVLRLEPDYSLDPFAVPPPAIQLFEKVRRELAPTLEAIRYEKRLREERLKHDAQERARLVEEQRKKIEAQGVASATRTVERRSLLVNFVPFGAGQFQQGRKAMGISLAVAEGLFAAASVVGYVGYANLIETRTVTLDNRQGDSGTFTLTERGYARENEGRAQLFRWLQLGGGAAFYTSWAFGVMDALYHHEEFVPLPSPARAPTVGLKLVPLPDGAFASLSLRF